MKIGLSMLLALGVLGVPVPAQDWARLDLGSSSVRDWERDLSLNSVPFIGPGNATTELSDYHEVVVERVADLSRRLTADDPRWDPWLRLWVAQLSSPGASLWVPRTALQTVKDLFPSQFRVVRENGVVSPLDVTAWTAVVGGALVLVLWGLSLASGRRRAITGLIVGGLIFSLGFSVLLTANSSGSSASEAQRTTLYQQHLWYQWALPYGLHWDDYAPGKAVVLADFAHRGAQIVPRSTVVFTPDQQWFHDREDEAGPSNVARLLGPDFP